MLLNKLNSLTDPQQPTRRET